MRVTLSDPETFAALPPARGLSSVAFRHDVDPLARFLAPYTEGAYALLRVVAGILFVCHGLQKLFGLLGGKAQAVGSLGWTGGVIELFAGAAIALGLWTTWAAFLASGEMAVAYILKHWHLAFDQNFFPVVNKGELAVLYCFLFLFMACRGSGRWSLDAARRRT